MTPSEKQKEIAVAFARFFHFNFGMSNTETLFDRWILTEEGKRLTAEETEKELKWLRATVDATLEDHESLIKENNQDIKALKAQFDRFEGRLNGSLFGD